MVLHGCQSNKSDNDTWIRKAAEHFGCDSVFCLCFVLCFCTLVCIINADIRKIASNTALQYEHDIWIQELITWGIRSLNLYT